MLTNEVHQNDCNMLKYACARYCSYIFSRCAKIFGACVGIAYVNQPIWTDYNFLGFLGQLMELNGVWEGVTVY